MHRTTRIITVFFCLFILPLQAMAGPGEVFVVRLFETVCGLD